MIVQSFVLPQSFADYSNQNLNLSAITLENETNADIGSTQDWKSTYTYVAMVCWALLKKEFNF